MRGKSPVFGTTVDARTQRAFPYAASFTGLAVYRPHFRSPGRVWNHLHVQALAGSPLPRHFSLTGEVRHDTPFPAPGMRLTSLLVVFLFPAVWQSFPRLFGWAPNYFLTFVFPRSLSILLRFPILAPTLMINAWGPEPHGLLRLVPLPLSPS